MSNCANCGLSEKCDEPMFNYFWAKEDNDCPYYKEKEENKND